MFLLPLESPRPDHAWPHVTAAHAGRLTRGRKEEREARVCFEGGRVRTCSSGSHFRSLAGDGGGRHGRRAASGGGRRRWGPRARHASAISDAPSDDANQHCGPTRGPGPQAPAKTPLTSRHVEPLDAGTAFAFGVVCHTAMDNWYSRDLGAQILNFWIKTRVQVPAGGRGMYSCWAGPSARWTEQPSLRPRSRAVTR